MLYSHSKGADQPAHPRSLISAFVVCCLDSIIPLLSISEISSLYLASLETQAGLCLTWSQTPKTGFLATRLNFDLLILKAGKAKGRGVSYIFTSIVMSRLFTLYEIFLLFKGFKVLRVD